MPMELLEDGWLRQPDPEQIGTRCMPGIPREEPTALIRKFANFSTYAYQDKLNYAGYKNIPVSYLFCERDQVLPPSLQQEGIDTVEKVSGNKVHVTRIQGDHCPNWTSEAEVLNWIVDMSHRSTV
ncbi:hypothetical protein LTR84_004299 [Exophiala bonariae]|uniref:AB hydrolase-1 domain-containing protein n=1 Tax=Exophiala bonariae TaxID=1690606 RepID=A0AAV9N556_9EURO|nr:hypothetical protein LTR84_004299 [Exophiala bonariae]